MKQKEKKKHNPSTLAPGAANAVVQQIVNQPASPTDPTGSYTGRPENPNEAPVQDADDL